MKLFAAMICSCGLVTSASAYDLLDDWYSAVDLGGNLAPLASAAFEADSGLVAGIDGVNPAYLADATPGTLVSPPVTHYLARFYLAHNELLLDTGDELTLFGGYDVSANPVFKLVLVSESGERKVRLIAYDNSGGPVTTSGNEIALSPGWRAVQLEWEAANAGSQDGSLKIMIDGVAATGHQNLTLLNNDGFTLDSVRLGVINGHLMAASSGHLKFDAFASYRDGGAGVIDKNCSGNEFLMEHNTFLPGAKTCVATTSLATGSMLTVDRGADLTLISPEINLSEGFSIPAGATLRAVTP